jgi:hypothetical protein
VSAARLAARVLALLGPVGGPVAVLAPTRSRVGRRLAAALGPAPAAAPPAGAVVVLLGAPARPAERQALLAGLRGRLPPGAPLVLVDHNQPRGVARRALGTLALAATGLPPARARYPAARELAVLGFAVDRLRLAAGERVQLIVAHR